MSDRCRESNGVSGEWSYVSARGKGRKSFQSEKDFRPFVAATALWTLSSPPRSLLFHIIHDGFADDFVDGGLAIEDQFEAGFS